MTLIAYAPGPIGVAYDDDDAESLVTRERMRAHVKMRGQLPEEVIHVEHEGDLLCSCQPGTERHAHWHLEADDDWDNPREGPWFVDGSGELHHALVEIHVYDLDFTDAHTVVSDIDEAVTEVPGVSITTRCWRFTGVGYCCSNEVPNALEDPDHIGLCDPCRTSLQG